MESVLLKHKAHQPGGKDSIGKENIPTSSTKEHNIGEDKEKEKGKEVQRQNLAHAVVLAASTSTTPVPPTSEVHNMEEQVLVSIACNSFSFDLHLHISTGMHKNILSMCWWYPEVDKDILNMCL